MKNKKERKKKRCRFGWFFRSFANKLSLKIHSPLFYDNEQTVDFDLCLK